jgi:hypothetical protein
MSIFWKFLQFAFLVMAVGLAWVEYAHGPELLRWLRFGSALRPDVVAAIAQADAAARQARVHADGALRNQALADQAAAKAREAMAKAARHLAGYGAQSPMIVNGVRVFGYAGEVNRDGAQQGLEVVNFGDGSRY